ncbi:choice-of-anchor tandem repeat GloVer-containing protein [Tunturiibacter gelidiferens]|uniref:choice-of-anchor tandem repeat GloVer-containing protein n=1 Tax=Tunturiibacter gelidiferens TaxID=3069689 RepID=UPI003D9BD9E0
MWTNRRSSSIPRTEHLRKFLSSLAGVTGIFIFATAALYLTTALYSQTPPVVNFKVPLKFNGTSNGGVPVGELLLDSEGFVYGATTLGGEAYGECVPGPGCGVLYKWGHGRFTAVHDFTGQNPSIFFPSSGLIRDAQGNLYGETNGSSSAGFGTVYRIDPAGSINVLHSFSEPEFWPSGGLIQDAAGNLYGVTIGHCNSGAGCGEVFRINPAGSETVLFAFPSGGNEGSNPQSAVVRDAQGNLYGTTPFGGTHGRDKFGDGGDGVLYKLTPAGKETVLHDFTGASDGSHPTNLVRDPQGNLYGYTSAGGNLAGCTTSPGCGVVYKYDTSGKFTVVYTFTGGADGAAPVGIPLLIGDSIYGATSSGAYQGNVYCAAGGGCGVVFKLNLNGTETVLHTFKGSGGDGSTPSSGLVMDATGNFWGATELGGTRSDTLESCVEGCGTLYTFTLTNP